MDNLLSKSLSLILSIALHAAILGLWASIPPPTPGPWESPPARRAVRLLFAPRDVGGGTVPTGREGDGARERQGDRATVRGETIRWIVQGMGRGDFPPRPPVPPSPRLVVLVAGASYPAAQPDTVAFASGEPALRDEVFYAIARVLSSDSRGLDSLGAGGGYRPLRIVPERIGVAGREMGGGEGGAVAGCATAR